MSQVEIHQCQCPDCQTSVSSQNQADHQRINLLMSRLDKQQRRWYAAITTEQLDHDGTKRIAQVTGLNVNTIRRGRQKMTQGLRERPRGRQRVAGGGRKAVEKKQPI